jgi:hypothetical protein
MSAEATWCLINPAQLLIPLMPVGDGQIVDRRQPAATSTAQSSSEHFFRGGPGGILQLCQ